MRAIFSTIMYHKFYYCTSLFKGCLFNRLRVLITDIKRETSLRYTNIKTFDLDIPFHSKLQVNYNGQYDIFT